MAPPGALLVLVVVLLRRIVPRRALVRRLDVELVLVWHVRIGLLRVLCHFCSFRSRSFPAGPWITRPVTSKREPWQGQSHERSAEFHCTWQPRWVQTADTACIVPSSLR